MGTNIYISHVNLSRSYFQINVKLILIAKKLIPGLNIPTVYFIEINKYNS